MAMDFKRVKLRRVVYTELRNVRAYRQALRKDVEDDDERLRMQAWVKVGDDLLAITRAEPDGDRKARFVDELFGITRRPPGNARFVYSRTVNRDHVSYSGVKVWRDNALFIASVLAVDAGAIDLSSE
jgi:hypothetical protein